MIFLVLVDSSFVRDEITNSSLQIKTYLHRKSKNNTQILSYLIPSSFLMDEIDSCDYDSNPFFNGSVILTGI